MAPTKLLTFKTRLQQAAAKKDGHIDGYFGKAAKGRPVGKEVAPGPIKGSRPMNMSTKEVVKAGTGKREARPIVSTGITLPANFNTLKASVIWHVKAKGNDDVTGILPSSVFIPRTTLQ